MQIKLLDHQWKFITSTARVAMLRSGRGAGKTFVLAAFLLGECGRNPGGLSLLGAQNPMQLQTVSLKALCEMFSSCKIPWVYGSEPPWYPSRFQSHVNVFSAPNGWQCLCRSMHEAGSDRSIRGIEVQSIAIDEARDMSEDAFDVASACLRGFGPDFNYRLRMVSTPNGRDWCWRRFEGDRRIPDSEIVTCKSSDNRHLPREYVSGLRAQYSAELAAQELDGAIVDLNTGRVFRFDHVKHIIACPPNDRLPLIFSLDFNVAPLCASVCQWDKGTRTMRVVDELTIRNNGQTRDICRQFLQRYPNWKGGYQWIGDEAGSARSTRTTQSDIDIMQESFRGQPARNIGGRKPAVVDSVNACNGLLDPAEGPPRLFVDPRCKGLIRDLEELTWRDDSVEGRKIDKRNSELSHFGDSLRYVTHAVAPVRTGRVFSSMDL